MQSGQSPWLGKGPPLSMMYFSIGCQLPLGVLYFLQLAQRGSNEPRS